MDNEKAIAEINEVIAKVEASLQPGCEVGARDKTTLKGLLKLHNVSSNMVFFPCQRENSAKIIHHFVKIKGIPQSRFSINAQPGIFILFGSGAAAEAPGGAKPRQDVAVKKEARERQEAGGHETPAAREGRDSKGMAEAKTAKPQVAKKATAEKPKTKAKSKSPAKGKTTAGKSKGRGKK